MSHKKKKIDKLWVYVILDAKEKEMAKQEDTKDWISFQIEDDLKERFEQKAKVEDRTISSMLRVLIKQYLGENE